VEHSKKVFSVAFVTNNQSAEILQPRKQPFNFPTSAIPSQATQVLGRIFSIHAVLGDQFNSLSAKLAIQFVGVIGIVAYQILGRIWDDHLDEHLGGQLHLVRRSALDTDGNVESILPGPTPAVTSSWRALGLGGQGSSTAGLSGRVYGTFLR
jgi:hypothetical protein